jgi:hypothetical protein
MLLKCLKGVHYGMRFHLIESRNQPNTIEDCPPPRPLTFAGAVAGRYIQQH